MTEVCTSTAELKHMTPSLTTSTLVNTNTSTESLLKNDDNGGNNYENQDDNTSATSSRCKQPSLLPQPEMQHQQQHTHTPPAAGVASYLSDPTLQQTVGSQIAGALATTVVYPLDTLKYRMMAQDNTPTRVHNGVYYKSTVTALRSILREEGYTALFRGLSCALVGTTASWGIYMASYRFLQAKARAAYVSLEAEYFDLCGSSISDSNRNQAVNCDTTSVSPQPSAPGLFKIIRGLGTLKYNELRKHQSNSANCDPHHYQAPASHSKSNSQAQMIGSAHNRAVPSPEFFAVDSCASAVASVFNAVVTTPIWHVKTRMQVEDVAARDGKCVQWAEALASHRMGQATDNKKYIGDVTGQKNANLRGVTGVPMFPQQRKNAMETLQCIIRKEGVLALWLGLRMQILLGAVNALYLPLYEFMRQIRIADKHKGAAGTSSTSSETSSFSNTSKLTTFDIVMCSSISKCAIAVLTNPLFVIRTRLQDERRLAVQDVKYTGNWAAIKLTVKREGVRGIFRGLGPSLYVTAPRMAITMVLMENVVSLMQQTFPPHTSKTAR